ncbi:MAG TPA: protein kinase [Blastocatellia bacterium]|nr:protein kinase [Blastocatellia bacterium]
MQTRYLIKRLLVQGDTAIIYEAEATHLEPAAVEIRETFSRSPEAHKRFQQEVAALAKLQHPALPKILDSFIEGSSQFLVAEFIPGQSLAELLNKDAKPFDWRQVADWADRLLDALNCLHDRQPPIFHRGIKPQALKLTPQGALFLTDLSVGVAASGKLQTEALNYLPLEQLNGEATDARSDLYSLGATLHFLLSGQLPDNAKMRADVLRYKVPDPLTPLYELNPQVPQAVAEVIFRALALNREARFQSANVMREALRQARQEGENPSIAQDSEAEAKRRREAEERKLQIETERRRQQEIAANEQREAEQRRRDEEKRFLAEQRRREEEQRHREARQRDLEHQRKQAEERRRQLQQSRRQAALRELEEERLQDQQRLELGRAGKSLRTEAAKSEDARKSREEKPLPVEAPVEVFPPKKNTDLPPPTLKPKTQNARLPRARWAAAAVSVLMILLVFWLWQQSETKTASQPLPPAPAPTRPAASPSPVPEQLQYWFEQFTGGQSLAVANHELPSAREFKLHFKSRADGYLYLLALDGRSGQLTAFLPGGARLDAGREFVFPNGQRIRGLAAGEQLRFTVVMSRNRIENFDAAVRQVKSQPEPIKSLQSQLGAIAPGSIEDFSGRGTTANVVSNTESPQPLIFDINLKFAGN